MTASLDRAVEAALDCQPFAFENCAYRAWQMIGYDNERAKLIVRTMLTAALPHLGVDREALRGLSEKWERTGTQGEETILDRRRRLALRDCSRELLQLIDAKQEPGHAR